MPVELTFLYVEDNDSKMFVSDKLRAVFLNCNHDANPYQTNCDWPIYLISINYNSIFLSKSKKGVLKGRLYVIKLATQGRGMRKYVIKKYAITVNYITVADNAITVAIGYTISLNNI